MPDYLKEALELCKAHGITPGGDPSVGIIAEINKALHRAHLAGAEEMREACAKVAEGEKVDAKETREAGDVAYNLACNHISTTIRARGKE